MLKVLWDRDGQSGAELGARLLLDSATITGVVDRLEAAEMVERRGDGRDRRVHRLFLTDRARALQQPLEDAMDQLNAEVRDALACRSPRPCGPACAAWAEPTTGRASMFDTKIAVVVRDDLAVWQKLNVTAFLTSGIVGANQGLLGERYEDAAGNTYNALMVQPMIVMTADAAGLRTIYRRAMDRRARFSLYIEDMFRTGHDAANRAAVKQYRPDEMTVVGLAVREDRKTVDKITKGAKLHG